MSNLNVLTKDLHRLGRDLSKTIIVDNSIYAFAYNLPNGIPIPSYYGQRNDRELISLVSYLSHKHTVCSKYNFQAPIIGFD